MVRLYIIRHGDPDYDTNREQGGSLTENGKSEATALSKYLASEGITHAYTSPLGRAKLTAQLALADIPQFSTEVVTHDHNTAEDEVTRAAASSCNDGSSEAIPRRTNFERNVKVEEWCREFSSWRQVSNLDTYGVGRTMAPQQRPSATKKAPAIWDSPAPIIRHQLRHVNQGDDNEDAADGAKSIPRGWKGLCPDYAVYETQFATFCSHADEFLSRHGILRTRGDSHYHLSEEVAATPALRHQRIAIFCHGGMGLTLLSHLLSIPLPMVHASMWLPPSSVTTVLFDEYACRSDANSSSPSGRRTGGDVIVVTPRAIQIGATNHLTAAGLEISNSAYEDGKRPAGIKHNFW